MSKLGIRDFILQIAPPWMRAGALPGDVTGTAGKYIYNLGLSADAALEKLDQAIRARFPGVGTPTALALIGRDRGIVRGIEESDASYALRLTQAIDDWRRAGGARSLLRQLRGFLFLPRSAIESVSESSVWDLYDEQIEPSDAPTHVRVSPATWHWDDDQWSSTLVGSRGWWRFWVAIFATSGASTDAPLSVSGATNATPIVIATTKPHGFVSGQAVIVAGVGGNTGANGQWAIEVVDLSHFRLLFSAGTGAYTSGGTVEPVAFAPAPKWGAPGAKWGDARISWGVAAPSSVFDALRTIASQWKGAHAWLRWLVVAFDRNLFQWWDSYPSASLPDGNCAYWGKNVGGVRVPSRPATGRYCDGVI